MIQEAIDELFVVENAEGRSISKLNSFRKFMTKLVNKYFPSESIPTWVERFINGAYEKGVNKSYRKTRKTQFKTKEKADAGLKEFKLGFNTANDLEKARLLYESAHERFKELGSRTRDKISRTLVEGFINGKTKSEISKEIAENTKVELKRVQQVVSDELVRAHSHGAIDALEKLGVANIEVQVEWSTSGDGKVCPLCKALDNLVIPLKLARTMFPRHPNCRCSPIPSFQKVSMETIQKSVASSIDAERPRTITRSFDQQRKMTRWPAKKLISRS